MFPGHSQKKRPKKTPSLYKDLPCKQKAAVCSELLTYLSMFGWIFRGGSFGKRPSDFPFFCKVALEQKTIPPAGLPLFERWKDFLFSLFRHVTLRLQVSWEFEFVWFNIPRRKNASRFHKPPHQKKMVYLVQEFLFDLIFSFHARRPMRFFGFSDTKWYANAGITKTIPSN